MREQPVPQPRTSLPAREHAVRGWVCPGRATTPRLLASPRIQHTFQCTEGAGRTFIVEATCRNSCRSAVEATGRTMADVRHTVEMTPH